MRRERKIEYGRCGRERREENGLARREWERERRVRGDKVAEGQHVTSVPASEGLDGTRGGSQGSSDVISEGSRFGVLLTLTTKKEGLAMAQRFGSY